MDIAGLVSSIITFVDFSWTIVRGAYDVHNSVSGATEENAHIGHVLQDLRDVTEKMRIGIRGRDDHEKALLELEHQCRALSRDLADILQTLTTKRRSGLQSLNILLRSRMKEKEVRAIEKRLGEYRGQMILRLNLILLERSENRHNTPQPIPEVEDIRLRDLKQKALALAADNFVLRQLYFDDMYSRADSITDATDGTFDWLFPDEYESSNATTLARTSPRECDATFVPSWEIEERQRCQENAAKISNFFEDGGGVFFLRGKPGSWEIDADEISGGGPWPTEVKMHQQLQKWAGQKKLVRLSTTFLLRGTPLQRSLEGFYRIFFFELLFQCPGLVELLLPKDPGPTCEVPDELFRSSFRLKTLQEAWTRFTSIRDHETLRICTFIDGLDELEGNSRARLDSAQTLRDWAQSDDVKIICSGRPNEGLNLVLDQPHYRMDLQHLMTLDILKIAAKQFQGLHRFGGLTEHNLETLADEICRRSEGVVLWAVLVAKNLEDDIIHGETLSSIFRTIQITPAGIDEFFDGIWQSLRDDAHQELILRRICEFMVSFSEGKCLPFSMSALSLYRMQDALSSDEFPYNQPTQELSVMEIASRFNIVRARMAQYTKHLVEVTNVAESNNHLMPLGGCRFVHRTAEELIQSKLGLSGPVSARNSCALELHLRLRLILEMNVHTADRRMQYFLNPHNQVYQLQYRMMEKLREVREARGSPLRALREGLTEQFPGNTWKRVNIPCWGSLKTYRKRGRAYLFLHIAIGGHQCDYVFRAIEDKTRQLDQEDLNISLLICVAGTCPNYDLFKVLVDHGAYPGSLVEVYHAKSEFNYRRQEFCSEFVPLGYCSVAFSFITCHSLFPWFRTIVETPFLASAHYSGRESREERRFVMDLAQVVRYAEPHNMDRLLSLLEPPRTTGSSLVQLLISSVLQPQFPFQTLPRGVETIPCRRVSDEFLRSIEWEVSNTMYLITRLMRPISSLSR
ncbi:hypothetical protein LA080_001253 [Diaporthe eres]|nr:hypothetical protein LA080_001253 [Diaporthe eres]